MELDFAQAKGPVLLIQRFSNVSSICVLQAKCDGIPSSRNQTALIENVSIYCGITCSCDLPGETATRMQTAIPRAHVDVHCATHDGHRDHLTLIHFFTPLFVYCEDSVYIFDSAGCTWFHELIVYTTQFVTVTIKNKLC
ncbi:hypothetical protein CSKR_106288 [Clonorchis sinensis]|uniref:Uncharacterized protein n=1 Tax=Clonorchis sinensis TaxID=79923 RepID=A0A3R7GJC9_CLOSI|nr:hypothetical protein CSKR_106288 [Clonorchis sinensis]